MKKNGLKKGALLALCMVVVLAVSFGIEMLGFNGALLGLPEEQKGYFPLEYSQLDMYGADLNADGVFEIYDSFSFAVTEDLYIGRLCVTTTENTPAMHIAVSGENRLYDIHPDFKETTIINVGCNARDVRFSILVDGDASAFELGGIAVDNTLQINWLRVLLMASFGFVLCFLLIYWQTALSKLHVTFFVLAVVLGINMALATPTWYGLDEGAHYIRAYQFAAGNLGFAHEEELQWIAEIEDFFKYTGTINSPHKTYAELVNYIAEYSVKDYPVAQYFPTTAATYPFVPYFFAGLGILIAKLLGMPFVLTFYAGRVMNVIGYALICALAVKIAKMGKRLLFLAGLVPYALFSAGVYTADTLTVSFAVLATALYLNMLCAEDGKLDWKLPVAFGLCVSAMAMCKLPYAPFCMLVLTVPVKKFRGVKQAWTNFLLVFAVVGIISVATLLFGADKGIIQWYQPGMSITGQVKFMLTHPFQYLGIMGKHVALGWKDYLYGSTMKMGYTGDMSGVWAAVIVAIMAAFALLDREEERTVVGALPKLACVGTVLCSWALVLTALYVSFNIVGASDIIGVQGRYFYPLLLPLLLLLKNDRIGWNGNETVMNGLCIAGAAVPGIAAVVHVFAGFCM